MSTLSNSLKALDLWTEDSRARIAVGVVAFALLTAVSAQIAVRLPLTPVPVTFQPLIVVMAGVVLGARAGALSMAAYVAIGALGAPIFSFGGAGMAWLLGPTGGYLLAAPAAAWVAGTIAGRAEVPLRLGAGLTLGVATMYAGGVMQLMTVTGQDLSAAVALGVVPFVVGDAMKVLFGFFAVTGFRKVRKRTS